MNIPVPSKPLMREIVFELCADTIEACLAARDGGADRIELCAALSEGGLTPSHGLLSLAIEQSGLPVHAMLRPRGGDFVYTSAELAVMREDLEHMRQLGVSGVVFGFLHTDGTVDVGHTRRFVDAAGPLEVTFHRAFDQTPSLEQALDSIIATGCRRVLTSGGEPDVEAGAQTLARLVAQAAGRIEIAVGGGLRLENAAVLARTTGARHFHGSVRRVMTQGSSGRVESDTLDCSLSYTVDSRDIHTLIGNLKEA